MSDKSCGAVVYRLEWGKPLFLLLHYSAGHWDFPKGHTEEGEEEAETAKREIREESGISQLELEGDFREKIGYFYSKEGKKIYKEVFFFLARTQQHEVKVSHEHVGYEWLTYEEALKRLTYENSRRVLKKAAERIGAQSQ